MGFWDDTWLGRAASRVGDGLSSAGSWLADAPGAVWDSVGSAASAVSDAVVSTTEKLSKAETWENAGKAVVNYGKFVVDNPGLALKQAGQGLSDSVTGLTGLAVDAVVYIPELAVKGTYNLAAGAVNLGAKDGENIVDYAEFSKFSWSQEWLKENTSDWLGYTREQLEEMAANGEISQQDVTYASVTSHATRAVGEVASFIAVSAATAGVGGAALASLRGGNLAVRAGTALSEGGTLSRVAAKPVIWLSRDVAPEGALKYGLDAAKATARWSNPLDTVHGGKVAMVAAGVGVPVSFAMGLGAENMEANARAQASSNSGAIREVGLSITQSNLDEWYKRIGYNPKKSRNPDDAVAGEIEKEMLGVGITKIRAARQEAEVGSNPHHDGEAIPGTVNRDHGGITLSSNFSEKTGSTAGNESAHGNEFNLVSPGIKVPLNVDITGRSQGATIELENDNNIGFARP